jgi:uncharacterized Tic20 family protein
MGLPEELERLETLRRQGALSEEEFARAKAALINGAAGRPRNLEAETRDWALYLHLSQLLGLTALPVIGWLAPILIWQLKKDELPGLDAHGRVVINWLISEIIYGVVCGLLCIVCVGMPLLVVLFAVGIVFPIVGGVKAQSGQLWPYPGSIRFLR